MGRGRGPNTADSYIGSLISLTSRSEIRYEGVLYTVDTENSNIALQNVRSFGTEGRKKEGPQIPASDKVYDYIIFRGSDIKDLQVKSSPPPPLHPPPPHQPTDPAIISLQAPHSQPQYPLPSSLGPYNVGTPAAGSSSEPSAPPPPPPPPPYMGMPPSPYRSSVPPLYPPAGVQSWGPPPPLPGANGSGLAMPMYWHGYYRPPPAGHMQHQPMPPQPPPSLAVPPQGQPQPQQQQQQQQPQPIQQSQQGPQSSLMPQQVAPSSRPQGPIPGSGSSAVVPPALQSHTQPSASSDSKAPVSSTVTTLAPLVAATTAPASIKVTPTVSAMSTAAAPVVSSVGTTAAASTSGVPISAASSLPLSMQGVSAMITPVAKNPRRIVGNPSQVPSLQAMGSFYQGPSTQSMSSAPTLSSESLTTPQSEAAQSSKNVALTAKSGPTITQSQVPPSLEQKTAELTNVVIAPVVQSSPQTATSQAQVSQPLLPLPTGEQNKQASAQQQGSHGAPVGRKNRWQGNGHQGNGNYNRRGRGRGSGSGRGLALANPTQQFTEDFDFTAMNEKFKKAEVRGTLGVKHDEEEYEYDDGNGEEDAADSAQSDAPKTALYNKHDFFDSLSCDATHGGRGERTKFSEQRKIDTETFGAFSARSSGGRGGRRSIHRGGYFGGGRGHYAIGRGGGHGRGRASSGNV